jgi:acyl-coenzyme A synthetase/AMP-(fatty) acid ligase
MYGLEASIFLPLVGNWSFHSGRPLFPEDVRLALEGLPAPRFLVTTPVHIRALLASSLPFPELCGILSATSPLTQRTAAIAESRFGCPIWEIYGFSEAGSVATRRTAHEPLWQLLDCITLQERDGALCVAADYLPAPVPFPDLVLRHNHNTLELLGRGADIVNIGGHRASLQSLNQKLLDIPGVEDGIFLPPVNGSEADGRMVAYVVASGSSAEHIMGALRNCIDPVFLPRPLHLVPSLMRNATGKITQASLHALARYCADHKCEHG